MRRGRRGEEGRKKSGAGRESEEGERATLSKCVCAQERTGVRTNTSSLVTSQLEASERVTCTLEGTCRIDTATSRITAIITHNTFIDV